MGADIEFVDGAGGADELFPYQLRGIYEELHERGMIEGWPDAQPPADWPGPPDPADFELYDLEAEYDPWVDVYTVDALDQALLPPETPENVRRYVQARADAALWTPTNPTGLQGFKAFLWEDCAFAPREIRAALHRYSGDDNEADERIRAFAALLREAAEHGGLRIIL